eukprot:m.227208 g.227208  ORF g.227208 m.227208 type:complete len:894 (+) comp15970_c1_seq16:93-2774(+)
MARPSPQPYPIDLTLALEFALDDVDSNPTGSQSSNGRKSSGRGGSKKYNCSSSSDRLKDSVYIHTESNFFQENSPKLADIVVHRQSQARAFAEGVTQFAEDGDDGIQRWVKWTHQYSFEVTEGLLHGIYEKGFHFHFWDSRLKVSNRARFDRPSDKKRARATYVGADASRREDHVDIGLLEKLNMDGDGLRVPVSVQTFFGDSTSITLVIKNTKLHGLSKINQIRVTLSLNRPLLSPEYQIALNPLVITVHSILGLPETPNGFQELNEKCYSTKIKLHSSTHEVKDLVTRSTEHGATQIFDQQLVYITGWMTPEDIKSLFSCPLTLQVHDRDIKWSERSTSNNELFSNNQEEVFNDYQIAIGKSKEDVNSQNNYKSSFGCSELLLSEYLVGAGEVQIDLPILPNSREEMHESLACSEIFGIQPGHYVQHGTLVSLSLKTHRPVSLIRGSEALERQPNLFISRIVLFSLDTQLFDEMLEFVYQSNCNALSLTNVALDTRKALKTYVLSQEQRCDETLDILTGFCASFPQKSVMVIEGLAVHGMQRFWNRFGQRVSDKLQIIYNSTILYSTRAYGSLGPYVAQICFEQSIEELLQQRDLYLHGGRGWGCLEGFERLQTLMNFGDGANYELPSPESIVNLSETYGITELQLCDMRHERDAPVSSQSSKSKQKGQSGTERTRLSSIWAEAPSLRSSESATVNFIDRNRKVIGIASERNKETKPEKFFVSQQLDSPVHMYSTHKLNSSTLGRSALKKLMREQRQDASVIYTMDKSSSFHHSTVYCSEDIEAGALNPAEILVRKDEHKHTSKKKFDNSKKVVVDLSRPSLDTAAPVPKAILPDVVSKSRKDIRWSERGKAFDAIPRQNRYTYLPLMENTGPTHKERNMLGDTSRLESIK